VPYRSRPKLRVGVFADSPSQPHWLVESLGRVATSDFAEIAVLCARERRRVARAGSPDLPGLWKAYGCIDRFLFGSSPDPLKRIPVELLVPPTRRIPFVPDDRAWRARIANLRLDVAVALGDIDDAALEGLARHGIWRHCFGDAHGVTPELAAVREVVDDKPVVASGIRVHRAKGEPDRVACRSWSRTVPFSVARSHDRLFGKASQFLARGLRQLHEHGEGWLERHGVALADPARERAPGMAEAMRDIGTLGARVAQRTIEHCFSVGQWSLAFRFAPVEPWDGSLEGFHRLMPPPDRFWADPFPLSVNGRHFIFFEELPFATGKGHINVVEVDRNGNASAPTRVLERDYHLSYPFLVENEGSLYMIPETGHNKTVEAYRCEEFPHKWKRERVLLDGGFCVDSTFHRSRGCEAPGFDNRWWMFANIGTEAAGVDDELHIFSADHLLGDWQPHRGNPVKSDVRSSRPAGRLFRDGERLYRPGQICAPIYGAGIALHRVTSLTTHEYAEEEDRRIVPCAQRRGRGAEPVLGIHTINRAGDLSVIDAFVRRRRF
jgi:hypothetical protein